MTGFSEDGLYPFLLLSTAALSFWVFENMRRRSKLPIGYTLAALAVWQAATALLGHWLVPPQVPAWQSWMEMAGDFGMAVLPWVFHRYGRKRLFSAHYHWTALALVAPVAAWAWRVAATGSATYRSALLLEDTPGWAAVALVVAGLAYVLGYGQHLMSKGPRHLHDWSRSAFTVGALSLGMVLAALWIGQEWPAWVFRGYCHIWLFQTTAAVMLLGWLQYRGHRWHQGREGA